MDTRVLVLGEVLIDVVRGHDGGVSEHVGGSPANVATGLARLGHTTDFATTLGPDPHGERALAHLQAHGVEVLPSSHTTSPTSIATATLDAQGAATYDFALHWSLPPVPVRPDVGHLHTGSLGATVAPGADQVAAAVTRARAGATVSYDPNIRPSVMGAPDQVRPHVQWLIGLSDVVKASDEDLAFLSPGTPVDEVLDAWADLGAALGVVTLGAAGAAWRVPATGGVCRSPALAPPSPAATGPVRDTVGAGDSFMAGLISGLLDAGLLGSAAARRRLRSATEADLRPALERALTTSALTVRRHGAYSPTRADLKG